jgi:UDP-2,4-diacetamido-2,4,6-trideoxy-beta-L-altropyranose hydrolase
MVNILFRVDFSMEIGFGHIMRAISLAQSFFEIGYEPVFVCKDFKNNIIDIIEEQEYICVLLDPELPKKNEINELNKIIKKCQPIATILDGYNFDFEYQKEIYTNLLVTIGTNKDVKQYSDIVVSPNVWNDRKTVPKSIKKDALYLSGPDYILLRKNFRREKIEIKKQIENVLITLGGSSLQNYGMKIYDSLKDLPYTFYLVANKVDEELKKEGNLRSISDCYDLSDIMKKCDLAITTAGITSLELASLGIPFLYYKLEECQRNNITYYRDNKLGIYMGEIYDYDVKDLRSEITKLSDDPDKRKEIQNLFKKLGDFNGAERVRNKIIDYHTNNEDIKLD